MIPSGGLRSVGAAVRLWISPARVHEEGVTPDYRFSLANERTFLAWLRTGLALVGGGFAVDQFLPRLHETLRLTFTVEVEGNPKPAFVGDSVVRLMAG